MFYLYEERTNDRRLFDEREVESLGSYLKDNSSIEEKGFFDINLKTGKVFHAYGTIKDYDLVLKVLVKNFSPGRNR